MATDWCTPYAAGGDVIRRAARVSLERRGARSVPAADISRAARIAPSMLADQQCVPCHSGVPPLGREQIAPLPVQLEPGWEPEAPGQAAAGEAGVDDDN